jgi:hypothetical protein
MALSRHEGDLAIAGTLTTTVAPRFPAGSFTDTEIAAAAGIQASKLVRHESHNRQLFAEGTTITALASELLHIVRGATGTVVAFEAIITTQATGGDRTVTVDLQKSTGGGAFATILTTTVNITNATVIRTPVAAVIGAGGALVDGDILRAVVSVAGSAGAQAAGLLITLTFEEKYS